MKPQECKKKEADYLIKSFHREDFSKNDKNSKFVN